MEYINISIKKTYFYLFLTLIGVLNCGGFFFIINNLNKIEKENIELKKQILNLNNKYEILLNNYAEVINSQKKLNSDNLNSSLNLLPNFPSNTNELLIKIFIAILIGFIVWYTINSIKLSLFSFIKTPFNWIIAKTGLYNTVYRITDPTGSKIEIINHNDGTYDVSILVYGESKWISITKLLTNYLKLKNPEVYENVNNAILKLSDPENLANITDTALLLNEFSTALLK